VLAGFVRVENEASDLGEEAKALARALRRCSRRLDRWQEATLPATAILRSRSRQASGLLYARRPSTTWDPEVDGAEDEEPVVPVVRKIAPKQRKSLGKAKAKVEPVEDVDVEADADVDVQMEDEVVEEQDEGEGGGDLDEEDRELLGEVDADESEEDEDEMMADE
jgi:Ino eighty subunit 1